MYQRLRTRSPCVAVSLGTHVGLNVATRACNVCPDKCWFAVLYRFWLQCTRSLGEVRLQENCICLNCSNEIRTTLTWTTPPRRLCIFWWSDVPPGTKSGRPWKVLTPVHIDAIIAAADRQPWRSLDGTA
jgi:hypothetical protein